MAIGLVQGLIAFTSGKKIQGAFGLSLVGAHYGAVDLVGFLAAAQGLQNALPLGFQLRDDGILAGVESELVELGPPAQFQRLEMEEEFFFRFRVRVQRVEIVLGEGVPLREQGLVQTSGAVEELFQDGAQRFELGALAHEEAGP